MLSCYCTLMFAFIIKGQVRVTVAAMKCYVIGLPACRFTCIWAGMISFLVLCILCIVLISPPVLLRFCSCTPLRDRLNLHLSRQHRPMPDCLQAPVTKSGKLNWCHPSYIVMSCSQLLTVKFSGWCWGLINLHAKANDSFPDLAPLFTSQTDDMARPVNRKWLLTWICFLGRSNKSCFKKPWCW